MTDDPYVATLDGMGKYPETSSDEVRWPLTPTWRQRLEHWRGPICLGAAILIAILGYFTSYLR